MTLEHLLVVTVKFDIRQVGSAFLHDSEKTVIRLARSNDLPAAHITYAAQKKRSMGTAASGNDYFIAFHIKDSLQ